MWTEFWDMHSGGSLKEAPYSHIFIEAPIQEAKVIFYNRFGHNPERVSCTCCGEDYAISEEEHLRQITAYKRNCDYDDVNKVWIEEPDTKYHTDATVIPLEEYIKFKHILVIYEKDIKPEERNGDVPEQGYVWID